MRRGGTLASMIESKRNTKSANPEIFNDPQAAKFLGVKVRTLREWRLRRGLPHIKITSKVVRYRLSDLQSWLDGLSVNGCTR